MWLSPPCMKMKMTCFARAENWGCFGASGSADVAAVASWFERYPSARAPKPNDERSRNSRRVRAGKRRLQEQSGMSAHPFHSVHIDKLIQIENSKAQFCKRIRSCSAELSKIAGQHLHGFVARLLVLQPPHQIERFLCFLTRWMTRQRDLPG